MRTICLTQPLKSIKFVVALHPLAFQAYVHIYILMPLCSFKGSEVNTGF